MFLLRHTALISGSGRTAPRPHELGLLVHRNFPPPLDRCYTDGTGGLPPLELLDQVLVRSWHNCLLPKRLETILSARGKQKNTDER